MSAAPCCNRFDIEVGCKKAEVKRLAKLASKSLTHYTKYRDSLTVAKEQLAESERQRDIHATDCAMPGGDVA